MWMVALALAVLPSTMGVPCSWVDIRSWSTGFKADLKVKIEDNLDDWAVGVEFTQPVIEVEAWKGIVTEISTTNYTISNKCYNNILYKCQCLVLPYIVRTLSNWTGSQDLTLNGVQLSTCSEDPCIDDGVKCGVQRIDPNCLASSNRIVNGEKTNCNEYPWMVGLLFKQNDGTFYRYIECGGALLNHNTVLTAASCIFTRGTRHREVLVSLAEWAPYVQPAHTPPKYKNVLVADIHIHPDYNQTNIDIFNARDVAVLKLSVEVDLSIYTPVCMPPTTLKSATDLAGQKTATIMGWGDLYLYLPSPQGGTITWNPPEQLNPNVLMKVSDLPIVTNQICNASASYSEKILEGMFCAGEDDQDGGPWPTPAGTGQGPCLKDSGGPLTVEAASGVHELVGLASWGVGCGQSYNVYTDVPYPEIEDWILEKAGEVYRYE